MLPDSGDGRDSNSPAASVTLSDDGRRVLYHALVSGYSGTRLSTFVHDRDADGDGSFDEPGSTATTELVSSTEYPSFRMSRDGRTVVSTTTNASQCAVGETGGATLCIQDLELGVTSAVVLPTDRSWSPSAVSADGRRIALAGTATSYSMDERVHKRLYLFDRESGDFTLVDGSVDAVNPGKSVERDVVAAAADLSTLLLGASSYAPNGSGGWTSSSLADLTGYWGDYVAMGLDTTLDLATMLQSLDLGNGDGFDRQHAPKLGPRAISDDGRIVAGVTWRFNFGVGAHEELALFDRTPVDLRVSVGDAGEGGAARMLSFPVEVRNFDPTVTAHDVVVRARTNPNTEGQPGATLGGKPCLASRPDNNFPTLFECRIGDLAPGASATGTLRVQPYAGALSIPLVAALDANEEIVSHATGTDAGAGAYSIELQVIGAIDAGKKGPKTGRAMKVTIGLRNNAPGATNSSTYVMLKPLQSVKYKPSEMKKYKCYVLPDGFDCPIASLVAGTSKSFALSMTPVAPGTFAFDVFVSHFEPAADRDMSNNKARISVVVP